jgi:Flp pilus assembly protein TadD
VVTPADVENWMSIAKLGSAIVLTVMLVSQAAMAVDTASDEALDLASVRAMIKARDFRGALAELSIMIAKGAQHADIYNLMGFSLRKTGDYSKALTFYQKALDFDPDHKSAHEYLGELYVETGQLAKAREHLAILERLCPQGCEEREDLERAIAAAPKTN